MIGPLNGLNRSAITIDMTAIGATTGRKIIARKSVDNLRNLLLRIIANTRPNNICTGTVINIKINDRLKAP